MSPQKVWLVSTTKTMGSHFFQEIIPDMNILSMAVTLQVREEHNPAMFWVVLYTHEHIFVFYIIISY